MKFTIPIEIVVDGKQVAREQAAMEQVATSRQDEPKRENPVRMLGLRRRDSNADQRLHRYTGAKTIKG